MKKAGLFLNKVWKRFSVCKYVDKSSLNVFMELFGGELSPGGEERPESPRMLSCLSPTNGDEGRNDGAAMP